VDDRLENIRRFLELCKGIVDASGVSQLSGAFGVLGTVLENVQVSDFYRTSTVLSAHIHGGELVRQLRLDFCDLAEKAMALIIAVQDQITSVTGVPSSPTFERSVAGFTKSVPLGYRIAYASLTTLAIQHLAGDCGHHENVCRIEMDDSPVDV
jgi:hypothetical protein